MAHRRVENKALAVPDGEHHWFVALALGAVGGGEDGHVFGGTAEGVVQLVLRVHPLGRHAVGDWVGGVADDDFECVLRAVAAAGARLRVADEVAPVVVIDVRPVFLGAAAPAAEADHPVVLEPARERVVGGMDRDEAPAVAHVFLERPLYRLWPLLAVVIADDHVVLVERRAEGVPLGLKLLANFFGSLSRLGLLALAQVARWAGGARWGGEHIDLEQLGLLHLRLHVRRHGFPVVVVLTVDEQHTDFFSSRRACRGRQEQGGCDPF